MDIIDNRLKNAAMTPKPSVGDAEGWTRRFLKYQALQVAAQRRGDIPAANRHVEKVTEALDVLAKTGLDGRMALERLMNDTDPSTRGRAARRVMEWDPDRAIPVLARLLYEQSDPQSVSVEAVLIVREARYALQKYFGLDLFDPTELPDRLAAMGITLPEKTSRGLRREN
ncbi:hypothetical protein [Oricola indica]|uniref:hypothetical protein n=1 Tax=Oricola indica TaxID=2872591 RepID=UPI001CBE4C72|nr:hypothetical protein [Oricola indica]